jgi:hypothetical protein
VYDPFSHGPASTSKRRLAHESGTAEQRFDQYTRCSVWCTTIDEECYGAVVNLMILDTVAAIRGAAQQIELHRPVIVAPVSMLIGKEMDDRGYRLHPKASDRGCAVYTHEKAYIPSTARDIAEPKA